MIERIIAEVFFSFKLLISDFSFKEMLVTKASSVMGYITTSVSHGATKMEIINSGKMEKSSEVALIFTKEARLNTEVLWSLDKTKTRLGENSTQINPGSVK